MDMPGRSYSTGTPYRYGASNGQEKSTEINGSSYTAEFWQYDARIVRRWNVDPVSKEYESPYAAFANNPIWIMDPNGADSTPVFNRIIDRSGNQVTTPTVVDLAGSRINPRQYPGMRVVGNNRVEVTPGDFMAEFAPNDGSNTQVFNQRPGDVAGGNKFTWNPDNSNGIIPPPPPPPVTPITQFNDQITGVRNIMGPGPAINQNLALGFNYASGSADAARFSDPVAGTTQINTFANFLRRNGIRNGVNIMIGTDAPGSGSLTAQYTNAANLTAARGSYIQGLFAARGISVNIRPPNYGTTWNVAATVNANTVRIIGWNVTTQAMQRQVLRGNVIPGSMQSVPGVGPVTNPQIGGTRPRVGNFTGPWRLTL
jgi:hypothetical protein